MGEEVSAMTKREEATAVLEELRTCMPRDFLSRLDELHKGTGFLLGMLAVSDGVVYAGDIAREMDVSTARIAVLLNKMEKNGFLRREPSPEDARKTVVKLTEQGRDCIRRTKEQALDRTELLLERVGPEDVWEFIRLSKKIKAAMEEAKDCE